MVPFTSSPFTILAGLSRVPLKVEPVEVLPFVILTGDPVVAFSTEPPLRFPEARVPLRRDPGEAVPLVSLTGDPLGNVASTSDPLTILPELKLPLI